MNLIDKQGMQKVLADDSYTVWDVRNLPEVQDTGPLGPSVATVPLPLLQEGAISLSDAEFASQTGVLKPPLDAKLVFTCAAGIRAQKAADIAEAAGYTDVTVYTGGAKEWFA